MTPATIIREAQAAGVLLSLSPTGTLKATGDGLAVSHWLAAIRQHKPGIIEALKSADTAPASRWWRLHFADREAMEVSCTPPATMAEILRSNQAAVAAEAFMPTIRPPARPLTTGEESALRAWLAQIGETDAATIADVIGECQVDDDVRAGFLRQADTFGDDLRTCTQCANLSGRRCRVAGPDGLVIASRGHEPIRDQLKRCEGYAPGADDPDQRRGAERWPGINQKRTSDGE